MKDHINGKYKKIMMEMYKWKKIVLKLYSQVTILKQITIIHNLTLILVVHEKKLFTCKFCSKTFSNRCGFNSHVKSVHEGKWEYCTLCNGKFQDKGDLRRHTKNVHERNYSFRCDQCGRGFPYRTPMKEHMLKHHGIPLEENKLLISENCNESDVSLLANSKCTNKKS